MLARSMMAMIAVAGLSMGTALANGAGDALPGSAVVSCAVVGTTGSGENMEILYSSRCSAVTTQAIESSHGSGEGQHVHYADSIPQPVRSMARVVGEEGSGNNRTPIYAHAGDQDPSSQRSVSATNLR